MMQLSNPRRLAHLGLMLAAVLLAVPSLRAQNYSWDARSVGMGGQTGLGDGNPATAMVPNDRNYTSIVVPLGLIQVFSHLEVFDPNDPDFDALRAVDYIGNPFHYSFNRNQKSGSVDFIKNIVDSGFSRDLNVYRGFAPPEYLRAGGLLSPNWGYTFKVRRGAGGAFQGIYVGAGPYVALQTDLRFDPGLIAILGSPTPVAIAPNTTFRALNNSQQQAAVAVTGGYHSKFGFGGSTNSRDGLYVLVDFNYLIGFRRDVSDLNLRIDTDSTGLVTLTPTSTPLVIDYLYSTRGRGVSTNAGFEVVKSGWEFGAGAYGIGNYIDWKNHHDKRYSMTSLLTGVDFVGTSLPGPAGTIRVELPVQYAANVGYSRGRVTIRTNGNYGLQKLAAHGGAELRAGPLALRGGVRYGLKKWNPTGGVGLNLTRNFGVDVGFFGNTTNLEQMRNYAMAVSLRFEHPVEP